MENAVDALKIAFAAIVFGIALTVSIQYFNKVKATSDMIIYTDDETNYTEYEGSNGKKDEYRVVGMDTIIPTVYKYYKENYTVVFRKGNYDATTGELTNVQYLYIYESASNKKTWELSYVTLMKDKYGININMDDPTKSKDIFSFDLNEETLRHEAWTGSNDRMKLNLDAFFRGGKIKKPNTEELYKDYNVDKYLNKGGFIKQYKDKKFLETIGEYSYRTSDDTGMNQYEDDKSKRVIYFTLIN